MRSAPVSTVKLRYSGNVLASDDDSPIFCARCFKELTPGKGEFYVVTIDSTADPTPPVLDEADMDRDYKSEINAIVAQLHELSPTDQTHRMTIHLCLACHTEWIEKPAG